MYDPCATCPFKTYKRVGFDGPVDAKLAIVGEAPAGFEVMRNLPFVGPSGQLLDRFLGFFEIPREQLRVGNVLLCGPIDSVKEQMMKTPAPPNSGVGTMFEHALACCAERREREGDLQSKVVLALGVSATWGLLGRRISLGGKYPQRGAVFYDWKGRAIFPTWHPAMLLKAGGGGDGKKASGKTSDAEAQSVANDLKKAWQFANGEIQKFKFNRCDPRYTVEFCEAARKRKQMIAVDVETDGMDALTCTLTIVGIAVRDMQGILALSLYWPDTPPEHREAVRQLLADPDVAKSAHNAPFDETVLERHDLPLRGHTVDTLLYHHAVAPECDHDLSSVACNYIITNPWKAEYRARDAARKRKGVKDIPDEQEYNAHDAAATLEITPTLINECRQYDVLHVAEFDTKLAEVARWMRIWGIPIDEEVRTEIGEALAERARGAREKIEQMAIEAIEVGDHPVYAERFLKTVQKTKRLSLASPFQLEALMDLCEVPVPPGALTKTGLRSTRNEIIAVIGHPLTRALVEYRTNEKLVSTFVEGKGLKLGEDGRIHPDWKVFGSVTGRWTSRPNCLNWKKDRKNPERNLRRMVVAPEGRIFVGIDKCVVKGTYVQTTRGTIAVEEITDQDCVILESGDAAPVQALIRRAPMQIFELTTRAGYVLRCTNFHRIRVIDRHGKYIWRRVGSLEKADCVAIQPVKERQRLSRVVLPPVRHDHHNARMAVRTPKYVSVHLAEWLGFLVGNGYIPHKFVSWTVCGKDEDLHNRLYRTSEVFRLNLKTGFYRGAFWTRGHSVGLSKWLYVMGFSRNTLFKFLWTAPAAVRGAFLRGLFEADGSAPLEHKGRTTVSVSMKSTNLAHEVQQILLGLGIFSMRFRTKPTGFKTTGGGGWKVTIPAFWLRRFQSEIGFMSARKIRQLATLVTMAAHEHTNTKKAGMPNLGEAVRTLKLTGRARVLLANTINKRESKVTPHIAAKIHKVDPEVYRRLELFRTAEYGTCFDQVKSIRKSGQEPVYDLTVRGPQTYLSNGFVSHNSQLEFRLITLVAGQEDLLEALSDPKRDVHSENTARLQPVVWQQLTSNMEKAAASIKELEQVLRGEQRKNARQQFEILLGEAEKQYKYNEVARKRLRELTKTATYASLYGSTAENLFVRLRSDEKLRDMGIEIELEQCQRFVMMFPELWPKIEAWRQQAVQIATAAQETISPILGRKRPFPLGKFDTNQALNYPIQSAGADLVGMEILDLWEKLDLERDWIILQIHDAIVIETDEDRAEEVAALMTERMTSEVELNGYKCLFPADARIGRSWDEV